MKVIHRRLLRLEEEAPRGIDDEGPTPAEVLRERIERQAEADGLSYEEPPLIELL